MALAKVILVPYPAQGHVTPMLRLASSLLVHGLEPLLVVPEFIHRRISPQVSSSLDGIPCLSIPDGLLDDGRPCDFFAVETAMEKSMPLHLERLLQDGDDVACLIVDLLASYAINVANRCGVKVVGFWPAMFATYRLIASIPKMVEAGVISDSGCPLQKAPICLAPDQPTINVTEMPWLIGTSNSRKLRFKFWKRTLDRSASLDSLLVNTFPDECAIPQTSTHQHHRRYPNAYNNLGIIPIPSIQLSNSSNIGSFWEEDFSCLDWLDNQIPGSVLYISFGSWVSPVGEAKVRSLALALESSRRPFLWVLGPGWCKGLPKSFREGATARKEERGQGRVVSWAPQMQVLRHEAVGCFLTHCGWNSTMEAIHCKKRLLCYPIAGDQFLNCAYIVDAWRIGVRLNGFRERDLDEGMQRVMEDREMSNRITRLNEIFMGKEAYCRTVNNLITFVNSVIRK